MAQKIIRSWEVLWKMARRAGCTHWNYSRGKLRFRPTSKRPLPIGHETEIEAGPPVRVRFYTLSDGEFPQGGPLMVRFRPPVEIATLPSDFDGWPTSRQAEHVAGLIEMLSAPRFIRQISPASRILLRIVKALQQQIADQERRITELQRVRPVTPIPKPADPQPLRAPAPPSPSKAGSPGASGQDLLLAALNLFTRVQQRKG